MFGLLPELIMLTGDRREFLGSWLSNELADFDKSVLQPVYRNPAIDNVVSGALDTAGTLLIPVTGGLSLGLVAAGTALQTAGAVQTPTEKANYAATLNSSPAASTTQAAVVQSTSKSIGDIIKDNPGKSLLIGTAIIAAIILIVE